ncbi:unnamed protein product, partial [Ectocarpus sp. 8 AP-2014]
METRTTGRGQKRRDSRETALVISTCVARGRKVIKRPKGEGGSTTSTIHDIDDAQQCSTSTSSTSTMLNHARCQPYSTSMMPNLLDSPGLEKARLDEGFINGMRWCEDL